jgi:hypothetical protein
LPLEDRAWQDKNGGEDTDVAIKVRSSDATDAAIGGSADQWRFFLMAFAMIVNHQNYAIAAYLCVRCA